ncbi:MAG TPA: hypothetical protein VEG65_04800 [Candidatus Bathyarchaeia archaeon]|nr:hypothetical protein [Candidatus Bathyarchaeia archaeon]
MSKMIFQDLKGPFDLSADRKRELQRFHMETTYVHFELNGQRTSTEKYILELQCVPDTRSGENESQYTCAELALQVDNGPSGTIPAFKNWTYVFDPTLSAADTKRPLWGIPVDKFERILDRQGNALPFDIRYAIYNNFIDFHSINDVFARPTPFDTGIQDLKEIGQKIVHPASFIEAPLNFSADLKVGSVFRNGEVTLELKGISVVDGAPCALVAYDAGESAITVIMPLPADQEIVTQGGSQYKGDVYVDLATRWVRKATLDEFLIAETRISGSDTKINSYTVRHITLRAGTFARR